MPNGRETAVITDLNQGQGAVFESKGADLSDLIGKHQGFRAVLFKSECPNTRQRSVLRQNNGGVASGKSIASDFFDSSAHSNGSQDFTVIESLLADFFYGHAVDLIKDQDLFASLIGNNGNRIAMGNDILPRICVHVFLSIQVVTGGTVAPTLLGIGRQTFGGQENTDVCLVGIESVLADKCHVGRNIRPGHGETVIKGIPTDLGHRIREADFSEIRTTVKRVIINAFQSRVAEINRHKRTQPTEGASPDSGQCASLFKHNALYVITILEHIGREIRQPAVLGERHLGQLAATAENALSHGLHRGRHSELLNATGEEGGIAQTAQGAILPESNLGKICAGGKSVSSNMKDAVGNGHGG